MSTKHDLKFEIVSDDLRKSAPIRTNKPSPIYLKLLNNETVFIPLTEDFRENALNKFYQSAKKLGRKLTKIKTVHNDVEGYVMWFSEREAK